MRWDFAKHATRRGDPSTSFAAAEQVEPKVNKTQRKIMRYVLSLGRHEFVHYDIEKGMGGLTRSTIRSRLAELEGKGAFDSPTRVWPPLIIGVSNGNGAGFVSKKVRVRGTKRELYVARKYASAREIDAWEVEVERRNDR